jgi:hypothetical protein
LSDYLLLQREICAAVIFRGTILLLLPELLLLLLKLGPACGAAFIGRNGQGWGRW